MHANYVRSDGTFGSIAGSDHAVRQFLCNLPPSTVLSTPPVLCNPPLGLEEEPLGLPVMNFGAEDKAAPSHAGAAGHPRSGVAPYQGEEEPLGLPTMQF